MSFITNALENGWTVKKRNGQYIFMKKHGGQKDVYGSADFLEKFVASGFRK